MANSDKNIVITPNIGSSSDDPKIIFTGANTAGAYPITLRTYPTSNGTVSFEGSAGQLFSITNSLSGTIFSVNDVSGMPSIEVIDSGVVKLAQYSGNVLLGTGTDNGSKLNISGTAYINSGTTDQSLTLSVSDSSWNYIGFNHGSTRKAYFGLDGSGNPQWGTDSGAFTITGNYTTIGTSTRSPIFYDSDDTGYYVNPASGTNLAGTLVNNGGTSMTGGWNRNLYLSSTYPVIVFNSNGSKWSGIGVDYTDALSGMTFWTNGSSADISGTGTTAFRISTGNYTLSPGSSRAPIFYDSDDTGYYVNPNSTSNLYTLQTNNYIMSVGHVYTYDSNSGFKARYTGGSDNYHGYFNWYGLQLGNNGANYIVAGRTNTGGKLYVYVNNTSDFTTINGTSSALFDSDGRFYSYVDTRSPIYYDNNDTGYYVNPAGTSVLNVLSNPALSDTKLYLRTNGDTNHYLWNADDDWEELVAYTGTGFRVVSSSGAGGLLYCYSAANGNYVLAPTSFRAPIFYDSDDTGYYLNPNSTSTINYIRTNNVFNIGGWAESVATSSFRGIEFHTEGNRDYYIGKPAGAWTQPLHVYFYTGLRHYAHQSYDYGVSMWNISSGNIMAAFGYGGDNVYLFRTTYCPSIYDYNDTGFYVDPNSISQFYRINAAEYIYSSNQMYSTIMYDTNDSGYYCNPNGTSNLNVVAVQRAYAGYDAGVTNSFSCSEWFRSIGGTGWYNASYTGGINMEDSTWVRVYGAKAFYVANQIAATGNITAYYSDERLKEKTGRIVNAVEKVKQLEGFYYVNNELAKSFGYNETKQQVGLSAQQVESILPEVVTLAPFDMQTGEFDGVISSKSGENYLTVDYSRLVPLLVEAIKEQQAQIEELKSRLNTIDKN